MATSVKKKNANFGNVFIKGSGPKAKKADSLLDIMDEYMYDTYNRSKEDMERMYGGKLDPCFHPSAKSDLTISQPISCISDSFVSGIRGLIVIASSNRADS